MPSILGGRLLGVPQFHWATPSPQPVKHSHSIGGLNLVDCWVFLQAYHLQFPWWWQCYGRKYHLCRTSTSNKTVALRNSAQPYCARVHGVCFSCVEETPASNQKSALHHIAQLYCARCPGAYFGSMAFFVAWFLAKQWPKCVMGEEVWGMCGVGCYLVFGGRSRIQKKSHYFQFSLYAAGSNVSCLFPNTRVKALPNAQQLVSPKRSLPAGRVLYS